MLIAAQRQYHNPLNLPASGGQNLLNPLNPHARQGVSKGNTTTLSHEAAVKP